MAERMLARPRGQSLIRSLKLRVLGSPQVEWDEQIVPVTLRRGLALLAYLAITGRPERREALSTMLWPDSDDREGRSRLRHALHQVSEPFGTPLFESQGDLVCLSASIDVWVDALELERCAGGQVDQASLEAAATLYRGELLSGFSVPDAPGWEDWQFNQRERFRELAERVLELLAERQLAAGEYAHGLIHARRWLSLDPLNERAHRLVMRLLAAQGRHAAAVRQFEQCARILAAELGVEPDPETAQLATEIRAHRGAARVAAPPASDPAALTPPPTAGPPAMMAAPGPEQGRLPRGMSSFVGREGERIELCQLLDSTRLLTLTGPGGIGKTRLGLELASEVEATGERDVRFVDLAPISDPARVPSLVATTLGVADTARQPAMDTLVRALRSRQMLLVLDSCEHLPGASAALVAALVRQCPGVSILATSRAPLGLSWEVVRPVPPLSVPSSGQGSRPLPGDRAESFRLFMDRATALRPSFTLGEANQADVAEICRRLEGLPLALELAAAWIRTLSPRQILERLEDRFTLLRRGPTSAPARQQTLAATIDWSHDLLSEPERRLFRRLAVFSGGWTLEAAEAVCTEDGPGETDILDTLASLVDKSLVIADIRGEQPRYRFLDTIRAYARHRLAESGEGTSLQQRHQRWFLELLRESQLALWGPDQHAWFQRLDLEQENVRAALDTCAWHPESVAYALEHGTFALHHYWDVRGVVSEGRERLEQLLALAPMGTPLGAIARTRAFLSYQLLMCGESERARGEVLEAETLARSSGDRAALFHALFMGIMVLGILRDSDQLGRFCAEGLSLAEELSHPFGTAPWNFWLSDLAFRRGDAEDGDRLLEESRRVTEMIGNVRELSTVEFLQGYRAFARGELDQARAIFQETLRRRSAANDSLMVPHNLDALAWVAAAEGRPGRAARLLGAAQAATEAAGASLFPLWQEDRERAAAQARSALGTADVDQLLEEGRSLTVAQAVSLALQESV